MDFGDDLGTAGDFPLCRRGGEGAELCLALGDAFGSAGFRFRSTGLVSPCPGRGRGGAGGVSAGGRKPRRGGVTGGGVSTGARRTRRGGGVAGGAALLEGATKSAALSNT